MRARVGVVVLVVVALALAALAASAGTATDPEITDASGDAEDGGPAFDIVRAFFSEDDEGTVLVRLTLSSLPNEPNCFDCGWAVAWWSGDTVYGVVATIENAQETPILENVQPELEARFTFATRSGRTGDASFPYTEIEPVSGRYVGGSPGELRFTLPRAALPDGTDGAVLEAPFAEALETNGGEWELVDRGPDCVPGRGVDCDDICAAGPGSCPAGRDYRLGGSGPVQAGGSSPPERDGRTGLAAGPVPILLTGGLLVAVLTVTGVAVRRRRHGRPDRFGTQPDVGRAREDAPDERAAPADPPSTQAGDWEAVLARPLPAIGSLDERYRPVRELPTGAYGRAILAEDTAMQRQVVVKVLHDRWLPDDRVRGAFLREARIAGRIKHPNVVTVHDIVSLEGVPAIVMEYVEGGSLEDRLTEGPFEADEAARLTLDILGGLERVHAQGVYHRDLKPANVLLTEDGHAKVADFGVAHAPADTFARMSMTGAQPGTLLYMAPEQANGEPPDARTDLYAVGAILVEMLTGRWYLGHPPDALGATIARIYEGPPDLEGVPAPLAAVAAKALAKKREERYADAGEMREALEAAMSWGR